MKSFFENEVNLPLLAIDAAEDLAKLKNNLSTELKSTSQLSSFMKEYFPKRMDYFSIFADTYFTTNNEKISNIDSGIYKKSLDKYAGRLKNPLNLDKRNIEELIDFCVTLSDCSVLYENEMQEFNSEPCF